MIHDQFKKFVDEKIAENNDKINRKEGNRFAVLPSMANIFNETMFESSMLLLEWNIDRRGRFHQLIKNSKKRRAERERIWEKDKKEQAMINYMNNQADEIERLQEELEEYKQRINEHSKNTDLLKSLYEAGNIDLDENPIDKN